MKFWILISLSLVGCSQNSLTSQLLPSRLSTDQSAEKLRRISFHLRGKAPQVAEYRALSQSANPQEFLKAATDRYLQSPEHVGKMVARLDELFRLRPAEWPPEAALYWESHGADLTKKPHYDTDNAADTLFASLIRENLSWDTLITGRNYQIVYPLLPIPSVLTDLQAMAALDPKLPAPSYFVPSDYVPPASGKSEIFRLEFPQEDSRLAGAVTTGRFLRRYNTTIVNRNRGRAAAIFRIFLCDEMRAAVTSSVESDDSLIDGSFPKPDSNHSLRSAVDDPHGQSPDCKACHYKLDPLGEAFLAISEIITPTPTAGRLTYRRKDGTLVDLPGEGLGTVLQHITHQPEYRRCQVKHFWNWFIGDSDALSDSQWSQLEAVFDTKHRRPNDFIRYLLKRPEFWTPPSGKMDWEKVLPVLSRCQNCHAGIAHGAPADFTRLPFGGDIAKHPRWVRALAQSLDLAHQGADGWMPPEASGWKLTEKERRDITQWIRKGTPDLNGHALLDPASTAEWIGPEESDSSNATAVPSVQFQGTFHRYLSGHDPFRVWRELFPVAPQILRIKLSRRCESVNSDNMGLLGFAGLTTGELSQSTISPSFLRWWLGCFAEHLSLTWAETLKHEGSLAKYVGPLATELLNQQGLSAILVSPQTSKWGELPQKVQAAIFRFQVAHLFGHLTEKSQQALVSSLAKSSPHPNRSLTNVLTTTFQQLSLQEAFLRY